MKTNGIEDYTGPGPDGSRTCIGCDIDYTPNKNTPHMFCSLACRDEHENCGCGCDDPWEDEMEDPRAMLIELLAHLKYDSEMRQAERDDPLAKPYGSLVISREPGSLYARCIDALGFEPDVINLSVRPALEASMRNPAYDTSDMGIFDDWADDETFPPEEADIPFGAGLECQNCAEIGCICSDRT